MPIRGIGNGFISAFKTRFFFFSLLECPFLDMLGTGFVHLPAFSAPRFDCELAQNSAGFLGFVSRKGR